MCGKKYKPEKLIDLSDYAKVSYYYKEAKESEGYFVNFCNQSLLIFECKGTLETVTRQKAIILTDKGDFIQTGEKLEKLLSLAITNSVNSLNMKEDVKKHIPLIIDKSLFVYFNHKRNPIRAYVNISLFRDIIPRNNQVVLVSLSELKLVLKSSYSSMMKSLNKAYIPLVLLYDLIRSNPLVKDPLIREKTLFEHVLYYGRQSKVISPEDVREELKKIYRKLISFE